MAVPVAAAKSFLNRLFLFHSNLKAPTEATAFLLRRTAASLSASNITNSKTKNTKQKHKHKHRGISFVESQVKRRTRSDRELDEEAFLKHYGNDNSGHVPVLLGEVLDVFSSVPLSSFADCTLGAAGHSSAIIQAHPEMKLFVGLDVDPVAHEIAEARIRGILHKDSCGSTPDLQVRTFVKNYKNIKSVLCHIDGKLLGPGVDGILMDLGISSMQVNNAERGFSVMIDGPLDMRMNPQVNNLERIKPTSTRRGQMVGTDGCISVVVHRVD